MIVMNILLIFRVKMEYNDVLDKELLFRLRNKKYKYKLQQSTENA